LDIWVLLWLLPQPQTTNERATERPARIDFRLLDPDPSEHETSLLKLAATAS
jgi:hypothetical protein